MSRRVGRGHADKMGALQGIHSHAACPMGSTPVRSLGLINLSVVGKSFEAGAGSRVLSE